MTRKWILAFLLALGFAIPAFPQAALGSSGRRKPRCGSIRSFAVWQYPAGQDRSGCSYRHIERDVHDSIV